jgi:hypothetical protein
MAVRWTLLTLPALFVGGCVFSQQSNDTQDCPATEPAPFIATTQPISSQLGLGVNACGPCAVFNSLAWGDASLKELADSLPGTTPDQKVLALIDTLGAKPSKVHPSMPRYDPGSGTAPSDLLAITNDLLAARNQPPAHGVFLDLQRPETSSHHLRRVYNLLKASLDSGFPPVLSLRSWIARDYGGSIGFRWDNQLHHYVSVVDLPPSIIDGDSGFRFGYLDPAHGRLQYGYIYAEQLRPFAARREEGTSTEALSGDPFLVAVTPTLSLDSPAVTFHDRTIIVLNYAIFR